MPPRNRKRKVGLKRIDAALDAMRALGFSDNVVRKSVKKLLGVYGDDGWGFMEDAAYGLLIETILQEQEEVQPENLLAEGKGGKQADNANGIIEKPGSTKELCDEDACEEQISLYNRQVEIFNDEVGDSDNNEVNGFEVDNHVSSKDDNEQARIGLQLDFFPMCSQMVEDRVSKPLTPKPCYGWISEDEDDEFLLFPPAKYVNQS